MCFSKRVMDFGQDELAAIWIVIADKKAHRSKDDIKIFSKTNKFDALYRFGTPYFLKHSGIGSDAITMDMTPKKKAGDVSKIIKFRFIWLIFRSFQMVYSKYFHSGAFFSSN